MREREREKERERRKVRKMEIGKWGTSNEIKIGKTICEKRIEREGEEGRERLISRNVGIAKYNKQENRWQIVDEFLLNKQYKLHMDNVGTPVNL